MDIWSGLIAAAFATAILTAAALITAKLMWPHIETRIQRMLSEAIHQPRAKRYVDIDNEYRQLVLDEHNRGDH